MFLGVLENASLREEELQDAVINGTMRPIYFECLKSRFPPGAGGPPAMNTTSPPAVDTTASPPTVNVTDSAPPPAGSSGMGLEAQLLTASLCLFGAMIL